jgi:two-component system sensor histidine kinase PilS (NtrC family)
MLRELKRLMLFRVIILSLLLGVSFVFQVSERKSLFIPLTPAFYYFIGLFYLVTLVYAVILKTVKAHRRFVLIQMLIDLLFITGLISFTGGIRSYFPLLYLFSIMAASLLFYKQGAFLFASLSSVCYGSLLLLQLYGWVRLPGQPTQHEPSQVFYSLIVYMAAFYITALLSGAVSEELRRKKRELSQREVDYQELETFNRNIIESLDSGLLTLDLEGRIRFLNRTAERIFQLNGETLRHRPIRELFPGIEEVLERIRTKPLDPLLAYERFETVHWTREGKKIHLGFSMTPLTNAQGTWIGYTLIFQDITRFKEMEEQMKRNDKMAAIGQLAAGMAHEIRNPLASLGGAIQMLQSELRLDGHHQRLMEIVLRESERLNALISDFLLFAQPPKTNKGWWSVGKIIDETIDLFTHSPHYHEGIQIVRQCSSNGIRARVDGDQIKQVLWNLLTNAAQEMAQGGELRIGLGVAESPPPAGRLPSAPPSENSSWFRISVSDTGRGISPSEREKIFEPFYTTKDQGTGLGLSIVHKIIENHGGTIRVESEAGKGSTFTLILPVE